MPDPRDTPEPQLDRGHRSTAGPGGGGSPVDPEADVVVVGAGLAGLAAGAVAAGPPAPGLSGARVVVVEAHRPGGRARTDRRGDHLFNQGAHALYRAGEGRAVLGRLGLHPTGGKPPTRGAHVWRDGEVLSLPTGPSGLLSSQVLSWRGKAQVGRVLATLGRVRTAGLEGQSLGDWIAGLGLRPDVEDVLVTLARTATYAADLHQLSGDAGVRQLIRAMTDGVDYLDDGWQQLTDGLVGVLEARGGRLVAGTGVEAVGPADGSDRWVVRLADGQTITTPSVVLAAGSPTAMGALLEAGDPSDASAGEPIARLGIRDGAIGPEVSAACLDLGLARVPDHPLVFGLGASRPLYLSVHAPPARLAPAGQSVVHLLRYGARTAEQDRADLWALATDAGISQADVITDRFLHRMVVTHGFPQPGAGLAGRPAVVVPERPGLHLAGDWVGRAGLLADASLASAEVAGRQAAAHAAAERPRHPVRGAA